MTIVRRIRRTVGRFLGHVPASSSFEILDGSLPSDIRQGWQNPSLPQRQWNAFSPILQAMRSGKNRQDFIALAKAVKSTAVDNPTILEVGCGSGWNSEVLENLLHCHVRYTGADYSFGMVELGALQYPATPFMVCDAMALPFADATWDIVLSGSALMHILEYHQAILESRRVARRFAIFHTVTVQSRRDTTILKKRAYGEWVVEVVFNEGHLLELFREAKLQVRQSFESIPYDLIDVTGEHSASKTYLCEVI